MIDGLQQPSVASSCGCRSTKAGASSTRSAIAEWTKKYDPTRLVDAPAAGPTAGVGDVHDMHVYPGPGVAEARGEAGGVLGEFGGLGLAVDGHTWNDKTWGYRGVAEHGTT